MVYDTFQGRSGDIPSPYSDIRPVKYKRYNIKAYWLENQAKFRTCCGLFVTGPKSDIPTNLFVWALICIPSIFFFIFVIPALAKITIALPILFACICALTIIAFLLAQCTDPGYIPAEQAPKRFREPTYLNFLGVQQQEQRNNQHQYNGSSDPNSINSSHPSTQSSTRSSPTERSKRLLPSSSAVSPPPMGTQSDNPSQSSPRHTRPHNGTIDDPTTSSSSSEYAAELGLPPPKPPKPLLPAEILVTIRGQETLWKYCPTCHIYRPPLTSHCTDCNACCKETDHHCPFVSHIGQRNYFFFLLFVTCAMLYMVSGMVGIGLYLGLESTDGNDHHTHVDESTRYIIVGICSIFIIIVLLLLLALCIFHMMLYCSGEQTTKQKLSHHDEKLQSRHASHVDLLSASESPLSQSSPHDPSLSSSNKSIASAQTDLSGLQQSGQFPTSHTQRDSATQQQHQRDNDPEHAQTPEQWAAQFVANHLHYLQDDRGAFLESRTYLRHRPHSLI